MDKKEIKAKVLEHIRAGKNYSETGKALTAEGIAYPALKTSFYKWKQEIFPEEARHGALERIAERKKGKDKDKSTQSKAWGKGKQKEADESVFAEVLNDAIFYFAPCPQKGLTVEDVRKINVGGGIVGLVTYYTDINLNHPIIIMVTRTIMLVLKIRAMCYRLKEGMSAAAAAAKERLPGQGGVHS